MSGTEASGIGGMRVLDRDEPIQPRVSGVG